MFHLYFMKDMKDISNNKQIDLQKDNDELRKDNDELKKDNDKLKLQLIYVTQSKNEIYKNYINCILNKKSL